MNRTNHLLVVAFAGAVIFACSNETTGASPSSSSSSSGGSSCTPSTGDGTSACGEAICPAAQYCASAVFDECLNGCTASNDCAAGQYCDLSNPTSDRRGNGAIGTCRSCTPSSSSSSSSSSGGTGTCGDYAGAYTFTTASGSSSDCNDLKSEFLGSTNECNFTQSACTMTQACGQSGTIEFDIDTTNKGKSTTNVAAPQGNATVNCDYQFSGEGSSKSVAMACEISGGGTVLNCNFVGTLN